MKNSKNLRYIHSVGYNWNLVRAWNMWTILCIVLEMTDKNLFQMVVVSSRWTFRHVFISHSYKLHVHCMIFFWLSAVGWCSHCVQLTSLSLLHLHCTYSSTVHFNLYFNQHLTTSNYLFLYYTIQYTQIAAHFLYLIMLFMLFMLFFQLFSVERYYSSMNLSNFP